jgi:hypothetical protein
MFDNLENLIASKQEKDKLEDFISLLLNSIPKAKILITSRKRIGL